MNDVYGMFVILTGTHMVVAKGRYTESCTRTYMISGGEGESESSPLCVCVYVCAANVQALLKV